MKICPRCSRQMVEEFRFCSECGYDFRAGGETDRAQKVRIRKPTVKQVKRIQPAGEPSMGPVEPPYAYSPPVSPVNHPVPQTGQSGYGAPPAAGPSGGGMDYRTRAEEEYARGDYHAAIDSFQLAFMEDPGNFEIIMAKERLLEMLNRKEEAVECLNEAIRLQPQNRELWVTKSRLLRILFHEKGDNRFKKESEIAENTALELRDQLIEKGLCPECNGLGGCQKCTGSGTCHECGGTGVYKGVVKCQFCNGTGRCDRCVGSGRCPDCKGTGKLLITDCAHCEGMGLCAKCHGTGKHLIGQCRECKGTGYCTHCKGKGKIQTSATDTGSGPVA